MDSNATTADTSHPNKHGSELHVTNKLTNDNLFKSHQSYHNYNRSKLLRINNDQTKRPGKT